MKKVLLADEDESVRKMVARVIQLAGYIPLLAGSAGDALSAFRSGMPDLVVLELTKACDADWQSFEQMKHENPLVPFIAITALPNQTERALQRGIDTLMEKPLDLTHLLQTIARLLDRSEKERARASADHPSIEQTALGA